MMVVHKIPTLLCDFDQVMAYGIGVSVAYPPDTDTPGYEVENVGKPWATHVIGSDAGFFSAQQASSLVGVRTFLQTGRWVKKRVTISHIEHIIIEIICPLPMTFCEDAQIIYPLEKGVRKHVPTIGLKAKICTDHQPSAESV